MIADSLGDTIIRIKNAGDSGKESVLVPYSKFRQAVLEVLEKEGYIKSLAKKGKKVAKFLEVGLLYNGSAPRIQGVEKISHLSRRIYGSSQNIRPVRHGFGSLVLTTSKGVMTDKEARKQKVGGEILFKIW